MPSQVPSRWETVGDEDDPPSDRVGGPHALPGSDPDDLADWVLATAPRAVAFATSLLRDREKAEDVVQDCYCRLLAKADRYDLRRDGLKLLLRSVSNACINFRFRHRFTSLFGEGTEAPEVEDRSTPQPDQGLLDRELAEVIGRGLATLPVRQRAALELKSQGHSLGEVGAILGCSPSNAGVLIHRARAAMEQALAPYRRGLDP